ncbi:MAG: hypothetical protein ACRCVX_12655, partial [Shewanella sp.]
ATTGDWANSATTGEGAHSATTGEGANSATTGNGAIAAALGLEGKVKAGPNSPLICAYIDKDGVIQVAVGHTKRRGFKPHVWYQADISTGKLVECAEQST